MSNLLKEKKIDIKLLALDMDGTTYHSMGEIVKENIKPLQQAIKQGIDVAIVTGRPINAKPNKLIENGLVSEKSVIIGCNGACIYDIGLEKVISSKPISAKKAKVAFELLQQQKFKDVIIWGYTTDLNKVVLSHSIRGLKKIKSNEFEKEVELFPGEYYDFNSIKDNFNFDFFKLLAFNANEDFYNTLKKKGFEVSGSTFKNTLEINKKGINKKSAVKWLSKNWKVPVKNIMAIGDGANDLPMIKYAGVGVAIKNSIQEIKDIAQIYIDLTNTEGAVGEVVKKYVLK